MMLNFSRQNSFIPTPVVRIELLARCFTFGVDDQLLNEGIRMLAHANRQN